MNPINNLNSVVIYDDLNKQWLLFQHPVKIIVIYNLDSIESALRSLEFEVNNNGFHAAGFISYEAAPAFDSAFQVKPDKGFPLLWFGIFHPPEPVTLPDVPARELEDIPWQPSVSEKDYSSAIRKVKHYIREGDTYQVNYTFRLGSKFQLDPWDLFISMTHAQGSGLGAFINIDDWYLCSASHELFFSLEGNKLGSRPMKGTVPRGLQNDDDLARASWLNHSEKNRAENLMIVDMVRNDMGRIAEPGSVTTTRMFDIEKYPTLWQMTTTVHSHTSKPFTDILKALFPSSSITGAPKARTMEIISELETTPRRIYTGTIGFLSPGRKAQFNVAIRTALINKQNQQIEYGTGGGIVWDSESKDELQECLTKARIVTHGHPDYSLLESILWMPEKGCYLLEEHLQRLRASADYFSLAIDVDAIRARISGLTRGLPPQQHKLRLLVTRQGEINIEAQPSPVRTGPYKVRLAARAINSSNPFLYHKTTHRAVYEEAMAEYSDCDDVLLCNENNHITESCIANLVIEMEGMLYTPPVSCGLLPGVYRAELLRQGKIQERIIKRQDLEHCSKILLINSVRMMWDVQVLLP